MTQDKFGKQAGPSSENIHGLSIAAVDVAADKIVFADYSASPTLTGKLCTISSLATAVAGSGLTATDGVLSVGDLTMAANLDDDPHSIFVVYGEHDFHATTAKDTDFGVIGYKCTLIGGYVTLTQIANGTTTTPSITLSIAASGATPIATAITITNANTADGQSNVVGTVRTVLPISPGAAVDIASTAHIYAYTAADAAAATRSTGKANVVLFFQKSA